MGLFTDGFKLLKKASEPLYKTPKSIQETLEIMAVAENGIFEVSKNKYSKCYRFQDINYTTATEDEQMVKGVKNMIFGGEGLFDTVITGPGKVHLQTMTIGRLARQIIPYIPNKK